MDATEDEALVTMSDEDYEAYLVGMLREINEEAKKTKDLYMRITEMGRRVADGLFELDHDMLEEINEEAKKTKDLYMHIINMWNIVADELFELDPEMLEKL